MTSRTRSRRATPEPAGDDPFRYGWRYLRHQRPDGSIAFEQVPLTLEDVLHPEEEDFVVQSDQHDAIRAYLRLALKAALAGKRGARAFADLRFAWDVPGQKALGPDIAVVFGIRRHRKWSTFDVAKEGVRPSLVIEVTSPETRHLDMENKLVEYARVGVGMYVIIDTLPERKNRPLELYGYRLTPAGYVRFLTDARGWLWLEPVNLWLGVIPATDEEDGSVRLYDTEGKPIADLPEQIEARAEAEARAQAEAAARAEAEARSREAETRAQEAENRLHALEEELRRLREGG